MKSKPVRIDPEFEREMRDAAKTRLSKNLAKFSQKDLGTAEMTRLLRRIPEYKIALNKLRTLPKKEDIYKK